MPLPAKPTPRLTVTAVKVNVQRNLEAVVKTRTAVHEASVKLKAERAARLAAPAETEAEGGA